MSRNAEEYMRRRRVPPESEIPSSKEKDLIFGTCSCSTRYGCVRQRRRRLAFGRRSFVLAPPEQV
jgi:hypothetical protein